MSAKTCLSVFRIDNGYLIEYETGQSKTRIDIFGHTHELGVTGTRHAATPRDVAGCVEAILERMARPDPAPSTDIPDRI